MAGHLLASLFVLLVAACAEPPDAPFCEPGVTCPSASPEHCAAGLEARLYGRATFADGTCAATDDTTCASASVTCAHFGQCSAPPRSGATTPDACPKRSDRDHLASRDPRCTAGTCIAEGDDCQGSRVCREEGRCLAKNGVCVATEASCKAASLCETLGLCTFTDAMGGRCRPTASDCLRSERCRDYGDCGLRGERCAPCERSDGCRTDGLCALVDATCRATAQSHCRASEACRREGRCRQHQGRCER